MPQATATQRGVREHPDGLLVRLPARHGWLSAVPPAPAGALVTVSLTEASAAIFHSAELTSRGYEPIGVAGEGGEGRHWADFLVPRALAGAEPSWVRLLCGPDGRLYEPMLGPVRLLFAPVLAAHAGFSRGEIS